MPARFLLFFGVLTTLVLLVHSYLGWRFIHGAGLTGGAKVAAWVGVAAFACLLPLAFSARFWLKGTAADVVSWVGYIAMGLFSFVFTITMARDVMWLLMSAASTLPPEPERRTALLHLTNLAVLGSSVGLTAFGVASARRRAAIVDVEVPIAGLPAALHGFTIAQITDVHVGPTIKRGYVDAIVDGVNSIDADIVAVTGDVVDGTVAELGEHIAPFARLKGRHGVFFCTGNHEYYSGAEAWIDELTRLGLRVLQNEHVVVVKDGARVVVAGVHDYTAGQVLPAHRCDPQAAVAGAPADAVRILLAHQPRSCTLTDGCGIHLQLSGHTHGGQFLPWNFFVRLQQPFTAGLDRFKDMWVYTSRGTGYWGPPVRVGAPSEITRLRLVPAPAEVST
jgi:predicted MPP superfamily phosphohydrolase